MSFMMRKNGTTRFLFRFMESGFAVLLFQLVIVSVNSAQESKAHQEQALTPLAQLSQEAEQNNPQIQAARQGWKAAQQVPTQVSTLPDPH
jgi:outer membrane protein, heavy metal efflux system